MTFYTPKRGQKLFWSIMEVGSSLGSGVIDTYLVAFYLFDILGDYIGPGAVYRAALIGTIVAIGKIIQGIANLPVARISDHIHTRFGRRRIFILTGMVPWSMSVLLLFWVPNTFIDVFSESLVLSLGWLFVFIIFWNFLNAWVINPYLAMLPEIAKTSIERTTYQQWKTLFQFSGTVIGAISWPILGEEIGGPVVFILMVITAFIAFQGTREDKTVVPASVNFKESVKAVFQNKSFKPYIGTIMAWMAVTGMLLSLLPIIVEGILGIDLDSEEVISWIGMSPGITMSVVSGIFVVTAILIIPFIGLIQKKIGKKRSFQIYLWAFAISTLLIALLGALPFTPDKGTDGYYQFIFIQLILSILIIGLPVGGTTVLLYSIFADVIDQDPLGDKQRRESMYFAVQGVLDWFAASVGTFLMGLSLAIFGSSDFRLEDKGILETGSLGIRVVGLLAFLIMALSAYLFRKYPIEN